jgi:lactate dehydrogenase-like 2-hydroxyacid dehydrogenase
MFNHIVHFDVDEDIKPHLTKGEKKTISLNSESVKNLKHPELIEVISIKSQSQVTAHVIDRLSGLKVLICRTVGMDFIDLEVCTKNNITVFNIPDYGSFNISELALALILSGARNIPAANSFVHSGQFSYRNFLGMSVTGKTVGIIGTGRIGLSLIKLLSGFDVRIIAYDIYQNLEAQSKFNFEYVSLKELLQNSDIISIHIPLSKETKYLIDETEINLMKDQVLLVNTARGEIINTQALIKNISKFKMVCLDVLENEKEFNNNHPLLKYNNVIMTPHIGFFTLDALRRIGQQTNELIDNFPKNIFQSINFKSNQ